MITTYHDILHPSIKDFIRTFLRNISVLCMYSSFTDMKRWICLLLFLYPRPAAIYEKDLLVLLQALELRSSLLFSIKGVAWKIGLFRYHFGDGSRIVRNS